MKSIPKIVVPIIENGISTNKDLNKELMNKNVVIFGLPGAFTPTCSEKHLPEYIELYEEICKKNIHEIFCLSVNDPFVMISWFASIEYIHKIKGIADGNGEICNALNLLSNKKKNFMGMRCSRFALIVNNNIIKKIFIEKNSEYKVSTAKNILKYLN